MQKKKGISLIVLVITIIVMIILAGAIILSLNNAGIIGKANQAVDASNESQIKEMATTELILNGWYSGKPFTPADATNIADNLGASVEQYADDTLIIEKEGTKVIMYASGDTSRGKIWDGTSSSAPEIKENSWYIYTPAQLKFFADVVNGVNTTSGYTIDENTVVNLMSDLDLGARQINGELTDGTKWTPIGTTETLKFTGMFEGNNHVIRGVYISSDSENVGVFGNSDTIQNLTIKDSYVKSTKKTVGGIVGYVHEGDVINCHNVNTQVEGLYRVGGIVGITDGEDIRNCTNSGKIYGQMNEKNIANTGGIVGATYVSTVVDNCQNYGEVSGEGSVVGGIVGNSWETTIVRNCKNNGSVSGESIYVGGIVGQGGLGGIIEKNINTASIKGTETIGGIAGSALSNVKLCYNEGEVQGKLNIGGIVGATGLQSEATIENCYNKGRVVATEDNSSGIGGILGCVFEDTTSANINNNYSIGQIDAKGVNAQRIGGAIAYLPTSENYKASNNYYLEGTVVEKGSYTSGESKSSEYMKTPAFVTLLNTGLTVAAWEIRTGENNGYPVLIGLK